jgi:hypothetical protein
VATLILPELLADPQSIHASTDLLLEVVCMLQRVLL